MDGIPHISSSAAAEVLAKALADQQQQARPQRRLLAVHGTGRTDVVRDAAFGLLHVVPVQSELDLRAKLPPFGEKEEPTVYLVPWRFELPADLAVRFARRGRVLSVGPEQRLRALTGASADPELSQSPLASYLLRGDNPRSHYPVAGARLTEDALWAVWLKEDWGLETEGGLSGDLLLAWAARDARGALFRQALEKEVAQGVRQALDAHLQRRLGPLGPLALAQWQQGQGEALLAMGVICEGLLSSQSLEHPLVQVWLSGELKHRFAVAKDGAAAVARALADTTPLALRLLERESAGPRSEANLARRVVALADSWVRGDAEIARALAGSHRLPCAWRARLDRLGEALETGATALTPEAIERAVERQRALESHDFFKRGEDAQSVRRGEMAVRLLAWWGSLGESLEPRGLAAHSDAELLGQWYSKDGGFVDWARRWARGSAADVLGRGVQSVLARVDALRTRLDERFAEALAAWHEAARPGRHLVPIDRALEQIAVPFLKQVSPGEPRRRLLVLLMDGMGWAQASELLQSLAEGALPWAPLCWHTHGRNRVGTSPYPPVLANLPTITSVSRAAFFAGKPLARGARLETQDDPERFANHPRLREFCAAHKAPRLLLRLEGHERDGSAKREALSLIADEERGVVGIVINAIDASLKGDSQQRAEWHVDTIRSLADLLEAARLAGRHVLLASDHGHVPADRLETLSALAGGGARWRPFSEQAGALQPGERLYRGDGVYQARDTQGAVLLTTDTWRYGGGAHAGEHGGATLAEVVAPCVLLGWDDPLAESLPPELELASAYVPDWWHYAAPAAVLAPRVAPPVPPPPLAPERKRRPSVPENQLGLPGVALLREPAKQRAPADPEPAVGVGEAAATGGAASIPPSDPLLESDMLRARASKKAERERVTKAVRFLLARSGAAPADAFAQHMGIPAFRVEGTVALLTETLNVDGYEVLRFDREQRQLFLDKEKLQVQFEVKL
jgi:hypothetical protein